MSTPSIAELVAEQLAPYIGPFNATVAVKTFAQRSLKVAPEALTLEQVPALLDALRPMLNTLVGRLSTDGLLDQIRLAVK